MTPNHSVIVCAYYAELRAVEDAWYTQGVGNRQPRSRPKRRKGRKGQRPPRLLDQCFGPSLWVYNYATLREIDARHGITADDPRVYSVTAYLAERQELAEAWGREREQNGWQTVQPDAPYFAAFWRAEQRYDVRQTDCQARHFPNWTPLDIHTVDTAPKLWAHIRLRLLAREEGLLGATGTDCVSWEDVRQVYSRMCDLAIPGVPPRPYPSLSPSEARDELAQITSRLEREDEQRYRQAMSAGPENVGPPAYTASHSQAAVAAPTCRLQLDADAHTVVLDNVPHKVEDPKAFAVYQAIADARPQPITKARIQLKVKVTSAKKTIPTAIKRLPDAVRATVRSGYNGYFIELPPLS
jgi:hypothetical protein